MIAGCAFIDTSCGGLLTSNSALSAVWNRLLQKREKDRVARMRADEKEKSAEMRPQIVMEKAEKRSVSCLLE